MIRPPLDLDDVPDLGLTWLSRDQVGEAVLENMKGTLVLESQDSEKYRFGPDGQSTYLQLYQQRGDSVGLPRHYARRKTGVGYDTQGVHSFPPARMGWAAGAHLRPEQAQAVEQVVRVIIGEGGALLDAKTGTGKTIMGLAAGVKLQTRTLVLVHKERLEQQWKMSAAQFLGMQIDDVGTIRGPTCDIGAQITVASIESLCQRVYPGIYDRFGLIIADECLTGDTVVHTDVGPVRLVDFPAAGASSVLSYDGKSFTQRRVVRWIPRGRREVLRLTMDDGEIIRCTKEHLFLTAEGWVEAGRLVPGSCCVAADAGWNSPTGTRGVARAASCTGTEGISLPGHAELTGFRGGENSRPLPQPVGVGAGSVCGYMGTSPSADCATSGGRGFSLDTLDRATGVLSAAMCWGFCTALSWVTAASGVQRYARPPEWLSLTGGDRGSGRNTRPHDWSDSRSRPTRSRTWGSAPGVVTAWAAAILGWFRSWVLSALRSASRASGSTSSPRRAGRGGTWTTATVNEAGSVSTPRGSHSPRTSASLPSFTKWGSLSASTSPDVGTTSSGSVSRGQSRGSSGSDGSRLPGWGTSFRTITRIDADPLRGAESVFDLEVEADTWDDHNFVANGVVVHNCHHLAAEQWSRVIPKFTARYILGLSATLSRPDGMTPAFIHHIGPVVRVEAPARRLVADVYVLRTEFEIPERWVDPEGKNHPMKIKGKIALPGVCSYLAQIEDRNLLLARVIMRAADQGRRIIVLSHRTAQLDTLHAMMRPGLSGLYHGKVNAATQNDALKRQVILATYLMGGEGLDVRSLDTLVTATPMGGIRQPVGRILRDMLPGESEKKQPMVIDPADRGEVAEDLLAARMGQYRREGFRIVSGARS